VDSYPLSRVTASVNGRGDTDGFQKMNGKSKYGAEVDIESVGEGSEVELNQGVAAIGMAHGGSGTMHASSDTWNGEGIQVKTDVDLRIERVRREIEIETVRSQSRMAR
jgi:hypothetical protein